MAIQDAESLSGWKKGQRPRPKMRKMPSAETHHDCSLDGGFKRTSPSQVDCFFSEGFTVTGKGTKILSGQLFFCGAGSWGICFFCWGGEGQSLKRILIDPARSNIPSRPEPRWCEKNHHRKPGGGLEWWQRTVFFLVMSYLGDDGNHLKCCLDE